MTNDNLNDDALKELLIDVTKSQKNTIRFFSKMIVIELMCFTIIILGMTFGFFWYESQYEYTQTVTTTTQEVSGENSNINNVEGDMYTDDSSHIE